MKLLIVESPAKAKTISKYLDGAYIVKASIGHVRDLPKSNKKAIDIPAGFVPNYEISKGKEHVIEEIKALAKKADEIILATDPDREGEAIAWHLAEIIKDNSANLKFKNSNLKIKRATYHEITKEAILEGLANPRTIDGNLVKAQEARRVLDRLVGYDLSGLIWKKVRYGLSAGRVQSPALRIIMEREREIRAFKPEDYFVITVDTETSKDEKLTLTCTLEPRDKKEAERIVTGSNNGKWHVVGVEKTEVKRSPRAPFITSTLQQGASTRLGFSPSNTMRIAQKLYEAGHITYMRTDSTTLSKLALEAINKRVEKIYGKEYLQHRSFEKKSKNAQEAHEAIRPTHIETEFAGLNEDEKRLYSLIWKRTIASQMSDARLSRTKISANISSRSLLESSERRDLEEIPNFTTTGSSVVFPGWLKADLESVGEENILPNVLENDPLVLIETHLEEKQTQPPGRYSEAGLIKELEKRGIGRPSTYASTIRTLEDREYVIKENKALKPTDTGDVVSTFLEQNFPSYISDSFTAEMEDKLDDIANGNADYVKTLKDFYGPFTKEVNEKDKLDKATTFGEADPKYKCPKCESSMLVKLSRGGKFLSCDKYPECDGALSIDGVEIKKDEPIGVDPVSGLQVYVKTGRYGPYVQLGKMPEKKSKAKSKMEKGPVDPNLPKVKKIKGLPKIKIEKSMKPRMASIPKEYDPANLKIEDALKFLSLPRELGIHPETGKIISANVGRFGPYIVHNGDFRSLKTDNPYDISYERALEILKEPKKVGRGRFKKKVK